MSITNIFELEPLIEIEMEKLFNPELIFKGVDVEELDNDTFTQYGNNSEKIGIIIANAGFKTDPIVGSRKISQQKIKTFWQIAVVAPKELYYSHAGIRFIEVANALKGKKLSPEFKDLMLVDDERDFNVPQFVNDMCWLPMMFSVEAII